MARKITQYITRTWLHLYNLQGGHVLSTLLRGESFQPLPSRIAETLAAARMVNSTVSECFLLALFPSTSAEATVFSWGPLGGVALVLEDEPAAPRLEPHRVADIWQHCVEGFPSADAADISTSEA